MKLKTLLSALDAHALRGSPIVDVQDIVCDSRQVRPGAVFVAIPGTVCDGADFVPDAIARGAVVIVAEHDITVPGAVACIRVPDARNALARLANAFHGAADKLDVFGVTGTNGKTTVAYLIGDMLEQAGRAPGLLSTVTYRIGRRSIPPTHTTPDAAALHRLLAEMVGAGCRSVVLEVSSHALHQQRVSGVAFRQAVFTNLTRDHLDYHGDMETYFAAKGLLFETLGDRAPAGAAVNADDPYGRRLAGTVPTRANLVTYGIDVFADVMAENVRLSSRSTEFRMVTPWGGASIRSHLLGRFNVSNLLAAAAAGLGAGVPLDVAADSLSASRGAPGRLQAVPTGADFQVFVDYAHTDDALERVLETIRPLARGRLIVVFGCGGNRDRSKRPIMGAVAERLADTVVVTSDNPRLEEPGAIIDDILSGMQTAARCTVISDRREAIAEALRMACGGDAIVIAGKGHENFQQRGNRSIPFDDAQVVSELLAKPVSA